MEVTSTFSQILNLKMKCESNQVVRTQPECVSCRFYRGGVQLWEAIGDQSRTERDFVRSWCLPGSVRGQPHHRWVSSVSFQFGVCSRRPSLHWLILISVVFWAGEATRLVSGGQVVASRKLSFINDLAVTQDGKKVYFTDSSSRWQRRNYLHLIMEATADGRYDRRSVLHPVDQK